MKLLQRAALAALFLAVPLVASAEDPYPTHPVYIVVPFPAGGVADLLPRMVGEKLSRKWGQSVVVENKPGASGNIGMAYVAQQPANGYTLALAPTGNLTVNPTLFKNLTFDTARDFTPVTLLANVPNVLVVHPSVPAKTFQELVAYAKANPGKLNFASPGPGSGAHLGRAAEARRRHPDGARAVQGPRARGERPSRRPGAGDVRRRLHHHPAGEIGPAARPRGRRPPSPRGASRRAHRRRERLSRLRRDLVVRHRRAQRHA